MIKLLTTTLLVFWSVSMTASEVIKLKTFDSINLNADLYLPADVKEKMPAILIIEGSGKSGFTEEPEQSPFRQLANELAKNGIITLKFNKRGSGQNHSNGSFWKSTFNIDNKDAQAALDFLKNHKNVDNSQIYLVGHSFGGPHSLVLSGKNKIKGIVMLSSMAGSVSAMMIEQNKIIMELQGTDSKIVDNYLKTLEQQLKDIKINKYKCVEPACKLIDGVQILEESIQVPYLHEVLNLDFQKIALAQPAPLLFIYGNSDFVIPTSMQAFVQDNIIKKSPEKVHMKLIEKLDHFLVENNSKKESLEGAHKAQKEKIFKPVSAELVKEIAAFVRK